MTPITDLHSINNPTIYFKSTAPEIDDLTVAKLEIDTGTEISVCNSWNTLISNMTSDIYVTNIPLILIDISIFEQNNVTVNEISNMIATLHRCAGAQHTFCIGVVIGSTRSQEFIKELQNIDILGVLPAQCLLGYNATLDAFNSMIVHNSYWPKEVIRAIIKSGPKPLKSKSIKLTPRQTQVVSLICNRGLSNKKIAQILSITESTVKVHMGAIFKAYGVRNRTQMVIAVTNILKP